MKKLFVFILSGILLVSCLFSEEYDIRRLKWGMSFEEVQQIEGLRSDFYKSEDLLGMKVEVLFGCDNKGLYSVSYSTRQRLFAQEARKVLTNKYGEARSGLDYSHLVKVKNVLKNHPDLVVNIIEKGDFSGLQDKKSKTPAGGEKKILRNALLKRDMWEFGNTVALLVDTIEGAALTYWAKNYHYENQKLFEAFFKELKKKVKTKPQEKKKAEGDKF